MNDEEKLARVRGLIADRMDEILRYFKSGAKVTVCVRREGEPEKDLLLTNDDLEEVGKLIERSKERPGV